MIRPAMPEDMPLLVDIWLRASRQAHDFIPAGFWEARAEAMARDYLPAAEVHVLDIGSRVIGFAALNGDHLEALFVDPDVQGYGHGSRLMAHAMERRRRITLCVYSRNVRAVSLYRRLGFQVCGEREDPLTGEQETRMQWTRQPACE